MKKRKLVWDKDNNGNKHLEFDHVAVRACRLAVKPIPTVKQIADLCDRDAEDNNEVDFCGAHDELATVLTKYMSEADAYEIMYNIAVRGGLHGMELASFSK